MKVLRVKGLNIGEGSPKIVVSIVEKNREDIIKKANSLKNMKVDIVEWRIDFYEDVFNIADVLDTLRELRNSLRDIPILFTFRTKKEGGNKEISMEEYTLLNKEVANSGNVDFIDIEMFSGDHIVEKNISNIHKAGVLVVGSHHDFDRTPEKEEIIYRLQKIQDMGADILKVAVMPKDIQDVIKLLDAANEMYTKYADSPLVAISMGPLGSISRLAGEVFGSSMTFGSAGEKSAPGQIPLDELVHFLGIIHRSMKE
ncbi:MAG: type I 3-dehydroquinate dehydratase [Tissierella sp.]|nr:type I 3-dehydroquinate dehydratase [Tissierella sp.]